MKTNPSTKTPRRLLTCLFALVSCFSTVLADETADAVNGLQAAIAKETAQKKPNQEGNSYDRRGGDMSAMIVTQLRSSLSRGDSSQIDSVLDQIPVYLKSDAVREAADKLRAVLKAERAAKEKAVADRIDAVIAEATKAVQNAKKAADLDQTLTDLAHLQDNGESRYSENNRGRLDKTRNLREFVTRWQDYLFNRDAGNIQQAIQSLQNANNTSATDIIPRSEILMKIEELSKEKAKPVAAEKKPDSPAQKLAEIMEKTKTLDAIPASLGAIAELQLQPGVGNDSYNSPVPAMKNELNALLQAYREYQAGIPTQLALRPSQSDSRNTEAFNAVLPLRIQLLRLTVVRTLGVDENLKPTADEPIQSYLDRVMAVAQENADARLIGRVKQLQDGLAGNQNQTTYPFLQPLLAAQNQETAGQFTPAVLSYETALKTGGELVPAKAIGIRLAKIKEAHPEDFERGMQLFLNSTTPTQPPTNYGSRSPFSSTTVPVPGATAGKSTPSPSPASKP